MSALRGAVIAWPLLFAAVAAAQPPARGAAKTRPAAPAAVPKDLLDRMEKLLVADSGVPPTADARRKAMKAFLAFGEQIEAKYPHAPNVHEVRLRMFQAATWLARQSRNTYYARKMVAIARRIMASPNAPPAARVEADRVLIIEKLDPARGGSTANAEAEIRALARRYDNTPAAGAAAMYAAMIAGHLGLAGLQGRFLDRLEKDHLDRPGVLRYLVHTGRRPPFRASLPRLDGKRLRLGQDLLGKVVVLLFWAAESKACAAHVPKWNDFHRKYHPRGVSIVAVSLDKDRSVLKRFVDARAPGWIHTFSGLGHRDPTAVRCGVRGIPALWVIGRDGKVLSANARGDLARIVDRALATGPPAKKGK